MTPPEPVAPPAADDPLDDRTIVTGSNQRLAGDDDLDATVMVARAPKVVWVLELPDSTVLELENDVIVGRKPVARDGATALTIPDPTRTLSKSHARLRFANDEWTVEDLNSTNGLFLIGDDGTETEIAAGEPIATTERMLFGTLEVRLRQRGVGE